MYWAIGPRDPQEALEIWDCINSDRCSVHELLERRGTLYRDRERLAPILEKLNYPLDDREPLMKLLNARKAVIIGRSSCPELASLLDFLGVQDVLVLPLWSGETLLGCILVDNVVSAEPFHPVDVRAMDTFAAQAALAIERASLYRRLENKIRELERWSQEMSCQQESLTKLEKMAAVGAITSKVAHEIRNPVTAIGGLANYLMKSGENDEHILKTIVEEARRLEALVKDLIAFADSTCPSKTRLDLRTVLKKAVEEAEETLNSTKHSVYLSLDSHPLMLRVDPKHVRALVWNLVKNALEAMPDGGDVHISLRREGKEVVLEVSDQGVGIAPDLLEEVKRPSFSTKGGTGMGLPICLNVVEEYGGRLDITSSGEGTTVKVVLPLEEVTDGVDDVR
jgi:signal transduction histidine kinase